MRIQDQETCSAPKFPHGYPFYLPTPSYYDQRFLKKWNIIQGSTNMFNAWMYGCASCLPSFNYNATQTSQGGMALDRDLKILLSRDCPSNQQVSMAQSLALSKWYMVMSLVASLVAIGGSPSARVHQKSDLLRAPNCRTVQSAIWASSLLLCSTCVLQLMPLRAYGSLWWEQGSARLRTIWRILTHCALANTLTGTEWRHCLYR